MTSLSATAAWIYVRGSGGSYGLIATIFETTWRPRRGKLHPRPGTTASSAALYQLYVLKRQTAHRFAGCRKNCVEHGGRNHADCRFPNAAPEVVGRHNHRFDLRHLGKAQNLVTVEVEMVMRPFLTGISP